MLTEIIFYKKAENIFLILLRLTDIYLIEIWKENNYNKYILISKKLTYSVFMHCIQYNRESSDSFSKFYF